MQALLTALEPGWSGQGTRWAVFFGNRAEEAPPRVLIFGMVFPWMTDLVPSPAQQRVIQSICHTVD